MLGIPLRARVHLCLGLLELGPHAHLVKNLQRILELGADRGPAVSFTLDQTHLI